MFELQAESSEPVETISTYQYVIRNQPFPRKYLADLKRAQG